jgi:capsular exopolysaccharide synthesis family protein
VEENLLRVLLVTSSTPNEGKTTTASNLAVAMAQMGERVLLIDTDMRRHNLHKVFSLDNLIGISDMIVNHENIATGLNALPQIPNLTVVTGGTLAPNPSELLGSRSMRELLARFRNDYDRIILDSPPFLAFSDPMVLSRLADGVLFVVLAGVTPRDSIKKSVQGLKAVNSKVTGVILNNVAAAWRSSSYYYYPYYDYNYGNEEKRKKSRKSNSLLERLKG